MKMRFSVIVVLILLIFLVSIVSAETKSIREMLVTSKNVEEVFVIDDNHTYIRPKTNVVTKYITNDFYEEFLKMCTDSGNGIEIPVIDPITDKIIWAEIKINDGTYKHPVTGENKKFTSFNLIDMQARCKNYFSVKAVYGGDRKSSFLLETASPQPYVYKTAKLPTFDNIKMPLNGELLDSVPEIAPKFLFQKTYSEDAVYSYLYTLCKKINGQPQFVVNSPKFVESPYGNSRYEGKKGRFEGEMKEIDSSKPVEMFKYVFQEVYSSVGKEWYFACNGNNKFIAKGSQNKALNVYFAPNRALEGVNYIPIGK